MKRFCESTAWSTRSTGCSAAGPSSRSAGASSRWWPRRSGEHTGRTPELSTTGGTSDARFIAEICPEIVEFGPVNASIHKLNEHIELAALEKLPLIYLDALRTLLP